MSAVICFALFMGAMVVCLATGYDMFWALLFGIAIFALRGKANGYSWRDMWKAMWDEGSKILSLIAIFLLIGVITGLWRSCGTIAFFIYYGIQLITPKLFILIAFLLTCLLSYALGTSFGVVGTAGIILMAMARSGGVSEVVTAGTVLAGAFFGDRCSPVSSSASLVAALTESSLYDNLRMMRRTGWLPLGISVAIYAVLSVTHPLTQMNHEMLDALQESFVISPWTVLPAIIMLVLPLLKMSIRHTLEISIASAIAVTIFVQHMSPWETANVLIMGCYPASGALADIVSGGGAVSMITCSVLVFTATMYSGLLDGTKVLLSAKGLVEKLADRTELFAATTAVSIACGMVLCNQCVVVVMGDQLVADSYRKRGVSNEEKALDLENSGIVTSALIPWNIACGIPLQMMGVGSGAVIYAVFLYMMPLCYLFTKRKFYPRQKERNDIL